MRLFQRHAHTQGLFHQAAHGGTADLAFVLQFGDGAGAIAGEGLIASGKGAAGALLQIGDAAIELVEAGLFGPLTHDSEASVCLADARPASASRMRWARRSTANWSFSRSSALALAPSSNILIRLSICLFLRL
ncbi:hypothetical protein AJ88_25915 [Mesorhizobium amorphae CCBAU 01583]|nr:hypothetical protein AJ88_25915 [Mesorhizobium amorphae CCBAU 01583]